jgi:hypothetical protein
MSANRLRELDERIAELFRDDSAHFNPCGTAGGRSVDHLTIQEAASEASVGKRT